MVTSPERLPEPKTAKNRVHLDLRAAAGIPPEGRTDAIEAECTRLVALGARRVQRLEADGINGVCIVMQAPRATSSASTEDVAYGTNPAACWPAAAAARKYLVSPARAAAHRQQRKPLRDLLQPPFELSGGRRRLSGRHRDQRRPGR
jgi:hypothetical protein